MEAEGFSPTVLGVWNEAQKSRSIVDTALTPGQQVTVEANVTMVPQFNGFDVSIRYNAAILNATSIRLDGGLFDPSARQVICTVTNIDNTQGILRKACVLLRDILRDVNTGTLFFLEFKVLAVGDSPIDIDESVSALTVDVAYTSLDGFFSNRADVHEVLVLSVSNSASQGLAVVGEMVTVDVVVANLGQEDEEVVVELSANTTSLSSQNVMIPSGARVPVSFQWQTATFAPGVYRLTATATITTGDAFLSDNILNTEFVTLAIRDLALETGEVSIRTLFVNETVEGFLNASVRNKGTVQELAILTGLYNGTIFGRASALLAPGEARHVMMDWDTTGLNSGRYVLSANVTVLQGERDPSDNVLPLGMVTVFNTRSHDIAIILVSRIGGSSVVIGSDVSTMVTVRNNGPFNETFDARLFLDETLLNTWTGISITTLATVTLTFTWNSAGYSVGGRVLRANVTLGNDQDPSNDELEGTRLNFLENRLPVPQFRMTPGTGFAQGQDIVFNATDSYDIDGTIKDYTWDFGDGSPVVSGRVVAHKYSNPGTYNVTLTITDELGGRMSTALTVTIPELPGQSSPSGIPFTLWVILGTALALTGLAGVFFLRKRRASLSSQPGQQPLKARQNPQQLRP